MRSAFDAAEVHLASAEPCNRHYLSDYALQVQPEQVDSEDGTSLPDSTIRPPYDAAYRGNGRRRALYSTTLLSGAVIPCMQLNDHH